MVVADAVVHTGTHSDMVVVSIFEQRFPEKPGIVAKPWNSTFVTDDV
jgi:hypothetical protein